MSADKDKLNALTTKVEEIASTLSKISEELGIVSRQLKSLTCVAVIQTAQAQSQATTVTVPHAGVSKERTLDEIRMSFPEELEARLGFEDKGDYIIIKPKQFLGSENFAKIASTVRGMGGEYISAGKDSHFRVPKKKVA